MGRYRHIPRLAAALVILTAIGTAPAFASAGSDAWSGPLNTLQSFIGGAPCKFISIIAIVVAGIALIFGEDLGVFAKRLLMVVIATAMITGAASIFTTLFNGTSAGAFIH
jgi:type IV secretory pathway VirB2 component (pilin)